MEQNQMPQPGPGLCGSDREIFERVWGRVTRSGGAESPIGRRYPLSGPLLRRPRRGAPGLH